MGVSQAHHELIKKINRSLVLETIKTSQPISRVEITKELNLSKSTVSAIVDDLLERKLVSELGEGSSTKEGGRRARLLGFNPDSGYGIGVDIGGTKILVIITNLNGTVVFRKKVKTTNRIEEIVELIKQCMLEANINESKVIGMGIGVPGTTNIHEGIIIQASALMWTNLNLIELISPQFSFPVFLNNDVNCAALGERWLGSGDNSNEIFFIGIGTGIGSALISNGNIIYGYEYRSGEIGYFISREDVEGKNFNKMGENAVFEKKVSGTSLSNHGYPSEELFIEYSKGSSEAVPIINDFIVELSIGIANVTSLLNPEIVIIGGGVSESMKIVINKIQDLVNKLTPIKTNIKLASLGGDAGALGAIAYTFQQVEYS
ncbi:ROK family transcriptional regulator [Neobacillus sp. 179-J 1A1 HS]|uniref:ROK family transcriptional regulator n=1 Tax=Neobacillus driksii TaxID=3035913 RepID=UPI0035BC27C4